MLKLILVWIHIYYKPKLAEATVNLKRMRSYEFYKAENVGYAFSSTGNPRFQKQREVVDHLAPLWLCLQWAEATRWPLEYSAHPVIRHHVNNNKKGHE